MLENQVVVITGAGTGLGRELANAFCGQNCRVYGLGRTESTLQETAAIAGENFRSKVVDVADYAWTKAVIDEILAEEGAINILFNNAAIYPKENFLDETAETFASAININVIGVANTCKAVLPAMMKNNSGKVFNLGSWADLAPIAESAAYSCSKGGLHALTKGIAADLAARNLVEIEIHEWIPGHLNTQMSEYTGMDPAIPATWAVEIASRKASRPNVIYEQNWEWQPPKSLKQKVASKLAFWR